MISQKNSCPCRGIPYKIILALAKPVKPSPFVRPKDSIFPAHRCSASSIFCSDTTLKFARKSRQFMKVHIAFDEKFSSGLLARLEFLHTLQVVFQFIKHSFCARDRQVCSVASFHFSFFQSCPLPASSDEVFLNLSSFPCIYFHGKNCSYKI